MLNKQSLAAIVLATVASAKQLPTRLPQQNFDHENEDIEAIEAQMHDVASNVDIQGAEDALKTQVDAHAHQNSQNLEEDSELILAGITDDNEQVEDLEETISEASQQAQEQIEETEAQI